jgi:hypothetical protein
VTIATTVAVALGAALLFLVQPMIAKMALPALGGSPAVWNTSMVFFQTALLAGYAYAHAASRWLRPAAQVALHACLLVSAFAVLPLALAPEASSGSASTAVLHLLAALTTSVGLPFVALAATAPLLQRWIGVEDPYFLYAASNLGSFLGLFAFPFLLEPNLSLSTQSSVWTFGFAAFAVLAVACGISMLRSGIGSSTRTDVAVRSLARTSVRGVRRLRWILLAMVPSSALLGATQTITTDIAPVPLLWVLPLGTYLLTYALAFSRFSWARGRWAEAVLAIAAVGVAGTAWAFGKPWPWLFVPLHLAALFGAGMVCHGRLAADRPEASRLTEFFLFVGVGGVLGGAFNALLAPLLFRSFVEYPAALVLASLLRPSRPEPERRAWALALPAGLALVIVGLRKALEAASPGSAALVALVQVGIPCVLCALLFRRRIAFALGLCVLFVLGGAQARAATPTLLSARTYFGIYQVRRVLGPPYRLALASGVTSGPPVFHVLYHGTTRHGSQRADPEGRSRPTSYYHPSGPLGQIMTAFAGDERLDRIAVLGLGAGAIAAYGRPGQTITYYEIDPEVVRIARDTPYFSFLRDSPATIETVVGDGRLSIARAPDAAFGLVVVDAFSSDAIPVHLLTREAFELYLRKLRPGGLLAVHLTNQYLDLEPVLDALARDLGLAGLVRWDEVKSVEAIEGKDASTWAVLARRSGDLGALAADPRWARLPLERGSLDRSRFLWTDEYSNLWSVLE